MTQSIDAARADLLQRVHTEGVVVAYETALAICKDPKAPSPAKATASATIFRVAGYFDRRDGGDGEKQPHEMTPDELAAAIAKMERRAAQKAPSIFE